MDISYIILGHKAPQQIAKLVNRLDAPSVYFYVHIDKPVAIDEYINLLKGNPNCFFFPEVKRLNTIWGHVNAVKAALNGIDLILADHRNGYAVLMSGQDYPIKSNDYIRQFLTQNYGANFIECFPLPVTPENVGIEHGILNKWSWIHPAYGINGGLDRLNKYTFFLSNKRQDNIMLPAIFTREFWTSKNFRYAAGLTRRQPLEVLKLLRKRRFPHTFKPYAGSQWWALPVETLRLIHQSVEDDPTFLHYNDYTLLSDEIFFQTVVANNCKNILPSITYANFIRPVGPWPATFTADDKSELLQQKGLFARKFDLEVDEKIFNILDQKNN